MTVEQASRVSVSGLPGMQKSRSPTFAISSWITCSTLFGEMKYLRSLGSK
jgi:hypothetical protein